MDTKELIKKVKRIEIKTKGLSTQIFSGEYHSAFKGRGMAFSEVREYANGDEIRTIDWNVTARFNDPYVKVFEEERELTVILLIDLSGSSDFGTLEKTKREMITEIAAVLGFSAMSNNDKIGAVFFTDKVEKFISPGKGRSHVLRIVRELIEFQPEHHGTNIKEALRFFTNTVKKRSIAFLISDFDDHGFDDSIKIVNRKHDLIALRVHDKAEKELPKLGFLKIEDPETKKWKWVNTFSSNVRQKYADAYVRRENEILEKLRKSGVDSANIATNESYVKPLMQLFKKRV
ncbi:MAG: DUF58 domain-containing protein [Crocinitomicaceae bacterium]|nr:DUF58 domain-containing protein [Crocinitomicaceae bacterium]